MSGSVRGGALAATLVLVLAATLLFALILWPFFGAVCWAIFIAIVFVLPKGVLAAVETMVSRRSAAKAPAAVSEATR